MVLESQDGLQGLCLKLPRTRGRGAYIGCCGKRADVTEHMGVTLHKMSWGEGGEDD